jgi:hypothetical protein
MSALFFLVIPISWYLFHRQEQRHQFERSLFLTFDQLQNDTMHPRRDMTESLLVMFVGLTVSEIGTAMLWAAVKAYTKMTADPNMSTLAQEIIPQQIIYGAILAGGGIAMTVLGIRSILANRRYGKWKKEQASLTAEES